MHWKPVPPEVWTWVHIEPAGQFAWLVQALPQKVSFFGVMMHLPCVHSDFSGLQ